MNVLTLKRACGLKPTLPKSSLATECIVFPGQNLNISLKICSFFFNEGIFQPPVCHCSSGIRGGRKIKSREGEFQRGQQGGMSNHVVEVHPWERGRRGGGEEKRKEGS